MYSSGKNRSNKKSLTGATLDTLALSGTKLRKAPKKGSCSCSCEDDIKLNKATGKNDKRALAKRAKRNFLKNALTLGLVDAVDSEYYDIVFNGDDDIDKLIEASKEHKKIRQSYWNMFHCVSNLEYSNGKLTGRYCKNRLCLVCNSIRQAILLKKYSPVIGTWEDVYFVTLTVPNMSGDRLKGSIAEMKQIVTRIQGRIKKRLQRSGSATMKGIRKLECTYNPKLKNYHPHYHLIIDGKENANSFLSEWMKDTKHLGTDIKGQDIRKADRNAPQELFKYFTKIISSTDKDKLIFLDSLHTIFKAVRGVHVFGSFGFKLPKEKDSDAYSLELDREAEPVGDVVENFAWHQSHGDWISSLTGEMASNHRISAELEDITKRMIRRKNGT